MDHLFNRLDGAYPNRWRAAFADARAIANWTETWSDAFDEEGITPDLVAAGLRACRRKFDWPPSLTEFLSLCKPPINVDVAVYEAIEQMRARQYGKDVWSNPAIYWAAVKVGEYDMLSQTFSQIKPRFERALSAILEGNVLPVPERAPALPAPGKGYSSQEYGRQRLAELNASGVLRTAPAGRNIGWAQKIIAEEERTGKVQANRLRIAREAIAAVGAA